MLRVTVAHAEGVGAVVHAEGEIDALTAPELEQALRDALSSAPHAVVLDLSQIGFLGTAGLTVLIETGRLAESHGTDFRLVTGPRCVERALDITGLRHTFACYPSVEDALRAG